MRFPPTVLAAEHRPLMPGDLTARQTEQGRVCEFALGREKVLRSALESLAQEKDAMRPRSWVSR